MTVKSDTSMRLSGALLVLILGGLQAVMPLSTDLYLPGLPGWLFGISAERIKDETIRVKIITYRRECYDILWNVFKHDSATKHRSRTDATTKRCHTGLRISNRRAKHCP